MPDNTISPPDSNRREAGAGSVPPVAIVLLVGLALLAATNVYTLLQLNSFRDEVTALLGTHEERLSLLDGNVNRTKDQLVQEVKRVDSEVASTQRQIEESVEQVQLRVAGTAQTLKSEIAETREQSAERIGEVGSKLSEYQEATQSSVGALDGRVGTVEQEIDEATAKLQETIEDLTSVKGDLGIQSGLIATNADELAALKKLGDRSYYEFSLGRTKKPERVGPVSIKLTGTDRKRNRYTIELWADDKKIVKRRRTLLEPVQFYVEGTRIPYEIVVNKIDSGNIAGYLATPVPAPRG